MSKRWFVRLAVATIALFAQSETSDSMIKVQQMFIPPFFQNYGTSWIAGPEKYHYQFHISEQPWNLAREYCLALASDLVVIKSLQQMEWLISHYPSSNSIMPEMTVQIGLVLVDKENSTGKEWKWVDNMPLNATFLEWEILAKNTTEKILDPTERGRCALLSINKRILKTIPCNQKANFDYTNRFICQRSNEQHQEHERKNNPFYELFAQLIKELQSDALAKPKQRTVQPQEIKIQTTNVQEKVKDLLHISRKKDITENDGDQISKTQQNITKKILATVDPNIERNKGVDFAIEQKEKEKQEGESKNKIVTGNVDESQAKNFVAEGKAVVRKKSIENNKEVLHSQKHNFQQTMSKLCGENGAAGKDSRTWYEQFGDIFRNLNLFLKQEKSSDLRALLDNNDTNKTLVERLKEALHVKNNTRMSKPEIKEKKKQENGIEEMPQLNNNIHKAYDDSRTLAPETVDNINGVFLYNKSIATVPQTVEGRTTITDYRYDTTKPNTMKIYANKKIAEESEVNENGIYELSEEESESMLIERLWNLFNLDSNAINKTSKINNEIKLNMNAEQINRDEIQNDEVNEQRSGISSLLSTNRKKTIEYMTSMPHTYLNKIYNVQQASKRLAESSNEIQTSFELRTGNFTLFEKSKTDRNKSNIKTDIEKVINNMKHSLESAGEEIKRIFSYPRKWL